jgi:hypothetical protein
MVTWDEFISPMGENITDDVLLGNTLLLGLIIFLFILMFILMLRFTIPLVSIIMIPLIFWISSTQAGFGLGEMLIIVAIMVGIIFGIALVKWYRR